MSKFAPIERVVCSGCGRAEPGYYDRRKEHMAAAFRSGVQVTTIAAAYGVSPDWCMKLIEEQLGHEAVVEVISTYRVREVAND